MKVRFYRWYNAVLTALLSMLGYGCSTSEEPAPVEYGTPNVDFVIRGTVTDETDTPIQGIKTVWKEMPDNLPDHVYSVDSTITDVAGKYQIDTRVFAGLLYVLRDHKLIVQDIDGEANGGEFLSDTIDISKIEAKKIGEGDGKWNSGKYEINADFKLKKK